MSHHYPSNLVSSEITMPTMRNFLLVWFGQVISITGSGLSDFALGLWVFSQAGSVTQFAFFFLFRSLPVILFSPLAGIVADRYNRRIVMLISDAGSALVTISIAILIVSGQFEIGYAYFAAIMIAFFGAFQQPAYLAAICQLAPQNQLSRANGLVQAGQAIADILAPLLAGILLVSIKLEGILLVDFLSFLSAVVTLLAARFPAIPVDPAVPTKAEPIWSQSFAGWSYIVKHPSLLALMGYFAVFSFLTAMVNPLIPPLILAFSTPQILGGILSAAGIGLLLGSLILTAWGSSKRLTTKMLVFGGILGCGLVVMGLRQNIWLIGAGAFCAHFSFPFVNGLGLVLWQKTVQSELQGRIFATRKMVMALVQPLGLLSAGLLADRIFEPLFNSSTTSTTNLKIWWGMVPGRGVGLIFVLIGIMMVIASLATKNFTPLGEIEDRN